MSAAGVGLWSPTGLHSRTNRGPERPAETLVHNNIVGDNGTAGGTFNLPVLDFLVGCNHLWAPFRLIIFITFTGCWHGCFTP